MKKCIILIIGLITNINSSFLKCYNNINKNIIKNNPEYKFKIIINTSYENVIHSAKWKKKNDEISQKIEIENILKKTYYTLDNALDITYYNLTEDEVNNAMKRNFIRIKFIFEKLNKYNYDKIIIIRPDLIFNKKIKLDKINNFNIISGSIIRPCIFHNRDWDLCWISNKKEFKIWFFINIFFIFNYKIIDKDINLNYNNLKLDNEKFINNFKKYHNQINNFSNLNPGYPLEHPKNTYTLYHFVIYYMMNNGFKVTTLDNQNIFVEIKR